MVIRQDGTVAKRRAFPSGGFPSNTQSHLVAEYDGRSHVFAKTTAANVQHSLNGGTFGAITEVSDDPPQVDPNAASRGSFSIHGFDVYYCDIDYVARYDISATSVTAARPGVISLDGIVYNNAVDPAVPQIPPGHLAAGTFTGIGNPNADYGPPGGGVATYPDCTDGTGPPLDWCLNDCSAIDPCIKIPFATTGGIAVPAPPLDEVGEKTLNTGFALSYYDPIRDIFGRRTEVFALPYMFAPQHTDITGVDSILSKARTQYSKLVSTPNTPAGHILGTAAYKCAIWFTRGLLPAAQTVEAVSGGWWAALFGVPAMSGRMNETLFLEFITECSLRSETAGAPHCKKGDTALFESARYLDAYSRPVPSKFMTILPSGQALYFYPRVVATRIISRALDAAPTAYIGLDIGNYVEYSVKHPEQIARNTDKQRDSKANIPNLLGEPLKVFHEGSNSFLFTTQGLYRVGFSKGPVFAQVPGIHGVRSPNSLVQASVGTFYMSDEGVVWLKGNQQSLLDKKLGFGERFEALSDAERSAVAIGTCERLNQVLVWDSTTTCMVYDYSKDFASEFTGTPTTTYASYIRLGGNAPTSTLYTTGAEYPGTGVPSVTTEIEMWISEGPMQVKNLDFIEVKLAVPASTPSGNITVTVEARDHSDTATAGTPGAPEFADAPVSRTATITPSNLGQKLRLHQFLGMRGRMFRIQLTGPTGLDWAIQSVKAQWTVDETDDARST